MEYALKGIKVVEIGGWGAGPFAAMMLGDMGADIIKVEGPRARAEVAAALTLKRQDNLFIATNRGKKSLGLDLKKKKGKEIFYEIIKKSDIFLTNLRTGVPDKLGIGYATLRDINPKLIFTQITGYGLTPPYGNRPSFDAVVQAMSGGVSITGEPGRPPARSGIAIADFTGGLLGAFGTVCALFIRQHTGCGKLVDISLLDGQVSILNYIASQYLNFGLIQQPIGSGHQTLPLYRAFQCGDKRYIQLAGMERFEALCAALEIPELVLDERFDAPYKLIANRDELHNIIEPIFLQKTSDEWVDILVEADVPVSKVNTVEEVCNDPQVLARDMIVTIQYADGTQIRLPGNPVKFVDNSTPKEIKNYFTAPPDLGEHTDQILRELLGYPQGEIKELREKLVVF